MTVEVRAAADTHQGMKRAYNQDSVYAQVTRLPTGSILGLFVVADGVGGQKAGEIASQMTVTSIRTSLKDLFVPDGALADELDQVSPTKLTTNADRFQYIEQRLNQAVQLANQQIQRYAKNHVEEAGNMRSTVTCALLYNSMIVIANVGDSRAYVYSDGYLEQVTEDHSVVAEMVRAGHLTPEQARDHPHGNVITRALGNLNEVDVDLYQRYLIQGDQLLLCTDGLWEMVQEDAQIVAMLNYSPNPYTVTQALIRAANAAGGKDNIGVVVAKLVDPTVETMTSTATQASRNADTMVDRPPTGN